MTGSSTLPTDGLPRNLIAERERRFVALANAMPLLVWVSGPNGGIEYVNRRWSEYTGLTEAAVGDTNDWMQFVHPDDRPMTEAAWTHALTSGDQYEIEHRLRGRDGCYRWFLSRAIAERDAERGILAWYGTSTDIDEAKRSAKALREADERKDAFLATLAHELRNPLAPIRNAAQILASPQIAPAQLQWAQNVIRRQVKHMAWLLDDLLDIARITRGKLQLKKERVPLAQIMEAAIEAVRPLLDAKSHRLTLALPEQPVTLIADAVRLSQVVSNLLANAAKYTDTGGHIGCTAAAAGGTLRLTVRDDGAGLAPEHLERVFETFCQVSGGNPRSEGGLGIGLSIVKGLVELHGGTVSAASAGLGHGSAFTVNLPQAVLDEHAGDSLPGDTQPPARGCRVLVADDNEDAADSLALLLQISGHEVRVAHGGQAALALAHAFRPEIVLLDIGMPEINGYEVAMQLRGESWAGGLRLIALTGWGQECDRQRSAAAGFERHLTKPVDLGELERLLGSQVSARADPGAREKNH
jgi:PAS domain S-box-containing protein